MDAARMLKTKRIEARQPGRSLRSVLSAFKHITDFMKSPVSFPRTSRIERLRERGFGAVWDELGRKLAEENGRMKAYLQAEYFPAISNLWTRLKWTEDSIAYAKTILDVTAMNGMMSHHILSNAPEDSELTIYANEVSHAMRQKLLINLSPYIDKGGRRQAIPVSTDISNAEETADFKNLDVVLWWGSFQMLAGRSRAIGNSFSMLREGGSLVLMDIYPYAEARMLRYGFAKRTVETMALMSKQLDMGDDVKGLIRRLWMEKMVATNARPGPPEIIELTQPLGGQRFSNMRCICVIKPKSHVEMAPDRLIFAEAEPAPVIVKMREHAATH